MILITSFVFFLFVNNVRSELVSNSDVENVKRVVRGEYQYNHPPSAEFFSVPVAVYYEEGEQKEKSIQADVSATELTKDLTSFENETSEPVATASEPNVDGKEIINEKSIESTVPTPESNANIETTESLSSSPTESNVITISDTRNKMRDSKRFRPQEGLIIPVAVVYDVEPETLRSRKRPTVKTDKKPINRQQRNNISETVNDVRERESKSINEPREGPPKENIKAGIFPKRSQEPNQIIPIVQSENFVYSHSGNFHYSYEGGDGTKAYERGELRADKAGEAVEGSFSYTGKDGKDYSLTYTADENGYRPVGDHLPTPPPIPPAIARALKYLATKPTPESQTETYY